MLHQPQNRSANIPSSSGGHGDVRPVSPSPSRTRTWVYMGALLAGTLLLLVPVPPQFRPSWLIASMNLAHVPLFAIVAGCLDGLFPRKRGLTVAGSLLLAALAEGAQALVGRSASFEDFLRGGLGVACVAGWWSLAGWPRWARLSARFALVAATLCVAWWDQGYVLGDAWDAYRRFPQLAEFSNDRQLQRWQVGGGSLELVPSPSRPAQAARLTREQPGKAAEMILFPPAMDWSQYRRLHVWCYVPSAAGDTTRPPAALATSATAEPGVRIMLSIRDGRRVDPPARRFELHQQLPTGSQHLVVELPPLARGEAFHPLELNRIQSLHLVILADSPLPALVVERIYLD